MSFTIRVARSGEGRRSLDLWRRWLDDIDFEQQMAGVDGRGRSKNLGLRLYLAEANRVTVGLVLIGPPIRVLAMRHDEDLNKMRADPAFRGIAKLRGVAVDPTHQGEGIGSALVTRAVESTPTPTWIYGQCGENEQLRAFYERLGFTVHRRGVPLNGPFDMHFGLAGHADCWFTQNHTNRLPTTRTNQTH